jgi:hypothetical protein
MAVTGEPISSLACRGTRAVRLVMRAFEHNLQELTSSNAKANLGQIEPRRLDFQLCQARRRWLSLVMA